MKSFIYNSQVVKFGDVIEVGGFKLTFNDQFLKDHPDFFIEVDGSALMMMNRAYEKEGFEIGEIYPTHKVPIELRDLFDWLPDSQIKAILRTKASSLYSQCDLINQKEACGWLGSEEVRLRHWAIVVKHTGEIFNVSVGGYGVYNSEYGIWASVIDPKKKTFTTHNGVELSIGDPYFWVCTEWDANCEAYKATTNEDCVVSADMIEGKLNFSDSVFIFSDARSANAFILIKYFLKKGVRYFRDKLQEFIPEANINCGGYLDAIEHLIAKEINDKLFPSGKFYKISKDYGTVFEYDGDRRFTTFYTTIEGAFLAKAMTLAYGD